MDSLDLDYTHLGHADLQDQADLARVADELSGQTPGLDAPITAVQHSVGSDGKTLFVYVSLSDGISRVYSFAPGQPVSITDKD